eukprot:Pgem_evm2s17865
MIDLSYNLVFRVSNFTFAAFPSLQILNLEYNRILSMGLETFSGLSNLKSIYLQGNYLTGIPDSLGSMLRQCTKKSRSCIVHLGSNHITDLIVPDFIFDYFDKILSNSSLYLSSNQVVIPLDNCCASNVTR